MKRKSLIICLTGVDGAGKTTLAKMLTNSLNSGNKKFKYIHARSIPLISRPVIFLGELIFLHKENISNDYSKYNHRKKSVIIKHSFLSKVYEYICLCDYTLQSFIKLNLHIIQNHNIICDRYIYDDIISDLSVDLNYSKEKLIRIINQVLSILPKPDKIILIDVPEETAYSRKHDIYSVDYIKERRKIYLEMAKEYSMFILDGTKTTKELLQELEWKILKII